MITIKIEAIPPSVKVDWMLAALFKEISEYNLLSVEVTEAVVYWGYDVEAKIQIGKEYMEKVPDSIEIKSGRFLNVKMRGRQPSLTGTIAERF